MSSDELTRIVEDSFSRTIGTSPRQNISQLLGRLESLFPSRPQDGSEPYQYRPLGVQIADGPSGELVAGAQAVFVRQVDAIRNQVQSLLHGLEPIITDADLEAVSDLKANYIASLDELASEYKKTNGALLERLEATSARLRNIHQRLLQALGFVADSTSSIDLKDLAVLRLDAFEQGVKALGLLNEDLIKIQKRYESEIADGITNVYTNLVQTVRAVLPAVEKAASDTSAVPRNEPILTWTKNGAAAWQERLNDNARVIDIRAIGNEAEAVKSKLESLHEDGAGAGAPGRPNRPEAIVNLIDLMTETVKHANELEQMALDQATTIGENERTVVLTAIDRGRRDSVIRKIMDITNSSVAQAEDLINSLPDAQIIAGQLTLRRSSQIGRDLKEVGATSKVSGRVHPTIYNVYLENADRHQKQQVVPILRNILGGDTRALTRRVRNLPALVGEGISRAKVQALQDQIAPTGARIRIEGARA